MIEAATQQENELICERLLGWKRDGEMYEGSLLWTPSDGEFRRTTLEFLDWEDAGLILDAVIAKGGSYAVDSDVGRKKAYVRIRSGGMGVVSVYGKTPVEAIRSSALALIEYAESL